MIANRRFPRANRAMAWLAAAWVVLSAWLSLLATNPAQAAERPAVAFHYGATPPWAELQAFDLVVVDPGHVPAPQAIKLPHTRLAAYVALGELHPERTYAAQLPKEWLRGENRDWGSRLIDQAAPGWPEFVGASIIAPLWAAGYRSFFLDTLDSYQLFAKTPEERARQEAGLIAAIETIKRRYPEAELIYNRGFEIVERTQQHVALLAAESLFQGYDPASKSYRPVAEQDRAWLTAQLRRVQDTLHIPVIAIDYAPPGQRALARATARQIGALGFIPWIGSHDHDTLGLGSLEVMPRRILMIHSPLASEYELPGNVAARMGAMPLQHLGYVVDYADPRNLPAQSLSGRYAGIVVWLAARGEAADNQRLIAWLGKQKAENIPLVFMHQLEGLLDTPLGKSLGVEMRPAAAENAPLQILQQSALLGFERQPRAHPDEFMSVALTQGEPLLTLARGKTRQVAAALTPWGGYVMFPHAVATLPNDEENRWVIDPFGFFRAALRLPTMPAPDVTTESGRRILLVHMDGDGFVSRSELANNPFAGEVVRDRIVRKYALPMTLSIIEAELSPQGLYPQHARQLEAVARDIFRAPHVEMASHTYSHPFVWRSASSTNDAGANGEGYHLTLPGYRFNLQREIEGSIRYIESRLAPPGKKVAMLLWSGDCNPGRDALEWTRRLGVLNMNGGDTIATRSRATLTEVEGLGIPRPDGLFQVYAPNQNENVYTNNWTGPFYGFERAIETYELTEKPRRLKPIDIYFHAYIATKHAGMRSLDKVFAYAQAQETTPLFASEYARKVLDFPGIAIARTTLTSEAGWRIRGAEHLRTLRLPAALGAPDLVASEAIAGYAPHDGETYVHLSAASAELRLGAGTPEAPAPRLISANARIESATRSADGSAWHLRGHVPLRFALAHAENCQVRVAGKPLRPTHRVGDVFHYQLNAHAARPLETRCRN